MAAHEDIDFQLLSDAQTLVLGMVTARENGSDSDANLLISSFIDESRKRGISDMLSWGMLFSASVLWVDVLVECRAAHHGQSHAEAVQELGLYLAGGEPGER